MSLLINTKADIIDLNIKKEFKYGETVIMNLEITYPEIVLYRKPVVQNCINRSYRDIVSELINDASIKLFNDAMNYYRDAIRNEFPFHAYDVVMKYTITLNDNCLFSTYFDRYEFTGGAHGNTLRFSQNWDLRNGCQIKMKNLFRSCENYRRIVLSEILQLADINYNENPNIYFENYKTLIIENFDPVNFNLTPTGIAVYYQQYDIAPYATGIVVFDISYDSLGRIKPGCLY